MPLFTTDRVDQLFERFMKHQPNYKTDSPEADRIQAELDACLLYTSWPQCPASKSDLPGGDKF